MEDNSSETKKWAKRAFAQRLLVGAVHVDYDHHSGIDRLQQLVPHEEALQLQKTPFAVIQVSSSPWQYLSVLSVATLPLVHRKTSIWINAWFFNWHLRAMWSSILAVSEGSVVPASQSQDLTWELARIICFVREDMRAARATLRESSRLPLHSCCVNNYLLHKSIDFKVDVNMTQDVRR